MVSPHIIAILDETRARMRDAEATAARLSAENKRLSRALQWAAAGHDMAELLAIAEAARAYVTFPERPETTDPNAAHSWDLECERRYYALRDAVLGKQAATVTRPYVTEVDRG